MRVGAAALVLAGVAAVAGAATGGGGAGGVCPTGAPVRHFDVVSIDVDITLNGFEDHDPLGQMYVLRDRVAAVRAQEASKKVSIGEHGNDAIQPLAIRANGGDCVTISFENQSNKGDYGIHIDGVAFSATSSGDAIGKNAPTNVPKGGTPSTPTSCRRAARTRARTTCIPAPATATPSRTASGAR